MARAVRFEGGGTKRFLRAEKIETKRCRPPGDRSPAWSADCARLRPEYLPREAAFGKMKAMADGAAIMRAPNTGVSARYRQSRRLATGAAGAWQRRRVSSEWGCSGAGHSPIVYFAADQGETDEDNSWPGTSAAPRKARPGLSLRRTKSALAYLAFRSPSYADVYSPDIRCIRALAD